MEEGECPLCGEKAEAGPWRYKAECEQNDVLFEFNQSDVECERCGHYSIEQSLAETFSQARKELPPDPADRIMNEDAGKYRGRLHLISGLTRTHWHSTHEPLHLSRRWLDDQLASSQVPKTPAQCVDRLVSYLAFKSRYYGEHVLIAPKRDYPVAFARHSIEFVEFCHALREQRWLRGDPPAVPEHTARVGLSWDGWLHAEELEKAGPDSDQAFVAMSARGEMKQVYEHGIMRALDQTGYRPLCVNWREDNEKIDDERLITGREAWERMGVSERQFHRWVKQGKVPRYRIGGAVRYKWSDIERALGCGDAQDSGGGSCSPSRRKELAPQGVGRGRRGERRG